MLRLNKFNMSLIIFMLSFTLINGCNSNEETDPLKSVDSNEETGTSQPTADEYDFSILFVGNSLVYSDNIPKQVRVLAEMYGIKIHCDSICKAGAALNETKSEAIEKMRNKKYDYAIFQDRPDRPLDYEEGFISDINELCDEAKKNGITPVLYNPPWFKNENGKPFEEILKYAAAIYEKAASSNGTTLVNVGEAFVYTYKKRPDISLYVDGDSHPNRRGTYLTACMFVSTLFDLHVKDIAENNVYHGDMAIELGQDTWEFASYYKENGKAPVEIVSVLPGTNEKQ